MAAKTNYAQNAVLQAWLLATNLTAPAAPYVGLFTTAPSNDGNAGTEVSGGSYARVSLSGKLGTVSQNTSGSTLANNANVTFPTATANWGTVVDVGIFDAASAGHLLYYGPLAANQVVNNGNIVQFAPSSLVVQEL